MPSAAIASGGARVFARHGSPALTRSRCLPATVIANGDADPPLGELRHDGTVAAANNAAPGALADLVERAPLSEGQNLVVIEGVLEQVLALNTPPLGFTGGEGHVRDILKWDAERANSQKNIGPPGASRCAQGGPCDAAA